MIKTFVPEFQDPEKYPERIMLDLRAPLLIPRRALEGSEPRQVCCEWRSLSSPFFFFFLTDLKCSSLGHYIAAAFLQAANTMHECVVYVGC